MSLELPATPEDVMRGVAQLQQFCRERDVPEKAIHALMLCVEEVASNIVNHAYQRDATKTFRLALEHHHDRVTVEMRDHGPAFDPLQATAPNLDDPDARDLGGLGIHLVRRYSDELHHARECDANVLRLTKNFPPSRTHSFQRNQKPCPMPLEIKIKRTPDAQATLTVELGGSLDTATAPELEKQLSAALDPSVKNLVFDLEKLTFISSAGLRVFAASRKFMKQQNEEVSFVHMQPQVQEVFEIVKALPGISVFSSIAEFDDYIAARQRAVQEGQ